jgi:hypothetical protein
MPVVFTPYPSLEAKRLATFPRSESPPSQNLPDHLPEIDLEAFVARHLEMMGVQSHLMPQVRKISAVPSGDYKLVQQQTQTPRLFDVATDIVETTDLSANRPERLWGGETNDASPPKQDAKRKAVSK